MIAKHAAFVIFCFLLYSSTNVIADVIFTKYNEHLFYETGQIQLSAYAISSGLFVVSYTDVNATTGEMKAIGRCFDEANMPSGYQNITMYFSESDQFGIGKCGIGRWFSVYFTSPSPQLFGDLYFNLTEVAEDQFVESSNLKPTQNGLLKFNMEGRKGHQIKKQMPSKRSTGTNPNDAAFSAVSQLNQLGYQYSSFAYVYYSTGLPFPLNTNPPKIIIMEPGKQFSCKISDFVITYYEGCYTLYSNDSGHLPYYTGSQIVYSNTGNYTMNAASVERYSLGQTYTYPPGSFVFFQLAKDEINSYLYVEYTGPNPTALTKSGSLNTPIFVGDQDSQVYFVAFGDGNATTLTVRSETNVTLFPVVVSIPESSNQTVDSTYQTDLNYHLYAPITYDPDYAQFFRFANVHNLFLSQGGSVKDYYYVTPGLPLDIYFMNLARKREQYSLVLLHADIPIYKPGPTPQLIPTDAERSYVRINMTEDDCVYIKLTNQSSDYNLSGNSPGFFFYSNDGGYIVCKSGLKKIANILVLRADKTTLVYMNITSIPTVSAEYNQNLTISVPMLIKYPSAIVDQIRVSMSSIGFYKSNGGFKSYYSGAFPLLKAPGDFDSLPGRDEVWVFVKPSQPTTFSSYSANFQDEPKQPNPAEISQKLSQIFGGSQESISSELYQFCAEYFKNYTTLRQLTSNDTDFELIAVKMVGSDGEIFDLPSGDSFSITKEFLESVQDSSGNSSFLVFFSTTNPLYPFSEPKSERTVLKAQIYGLSLVDYNGNNVDVNNSSLDSPISIYLTKIFNDSSVSCLFWDETKNSWSSEGMQLFEVDSTQIRCVTNHLTNFTLGTNSVPEQSKISVSTSPNNTGLIVGIVVGGAFLLAVIAVVVFIIRKKQTRKKNSQMDELKTLSPQIAIKTEDEIELAEKLGQGAFGEVYKATLGGTTTVAVKKFHKNVGKDQFHHESNMMKSLHHPNVVQFYNIFEDEKGQLNITLEYMPLGNLLNSLQKKEPNLSSNAVKKNIAFQIAGAMNYLEQNGIIHCDLSARNILLKEGPIAKVSDFGMARKAGSKKEIPHVEEKAPVRWCAPEVLDKNQYSFKSDVWSFGILLWEIFNDGKIPYGEKDNEEVAKFVVEGGRLDVSGNPFASVIQSCWKKNPSERSSFLNLSSMLENKVSDEELPVPEGPRIGRQSAINYAATTSSSKAGSEILYD